MYLDKFPIIASVVSGAHSSYHIVLLSKQTPSQRQNNTTLQSKIKHIHTKIRLHRSTYSRTLKQKAKNDAKRCNNKRPLYPQ
ncbi:MAG: hypothetical protein CL932_22665 [Deltaproteobacteria bacterium]|nr:hypothetical protein [Deltaproteobacteria bacterium]